MHFVPINFSGPGFNPAYTADFELVILLNTTTFSYAVRHPATHRLVRLSTGHLHNQLFDQQQNALFAASNYENVIIASDTNSFCLIPDAVFTPENLADFAVFLSVKEADLILTDQIENGKNIVILTLPENLVEQVQLKYPSAKIQFAPKSWIKTVLEEKVPGQNLYLFLEEKSIKILFADQESIRFYNQFAISTTDELVYFTALVADQLNLKPEETSLLICGNVADQSREMLRLQEFFKEVKLFGKNDFDQKNELHYHQVIQFLGLN
ncbi:DUF3822 family protein [Mucilaginibacter sp.]|uniref:DUF3822 family protein n=1 Tax=Mucilaginibacter sp. TaxID=1882438 RepID=UPI003AFFEA78